MDIPYAFDSLAKAGTMLGSGAIIVADESTPILDVALKVARFYRHESCGKCTPCREGTNWTVKMLQRIGTGDATPMDLELMASVCQNIIGNCLCVLGDAMAMPIGSIIAKFRDELDETTDAEADVADAETEVAEAEAAHEHMLAVARAGMRECDLAVEVNLYARERGANDNFLMLSAGPNQLGIVASNNRPVERGNIISAEGTPAYDGQFAQICRSVSVGPPSNLQAEKYALLVRAMKAGIAVIRPGAKVSDIAEAIDAVMTEAGYEKYNRPPYLNRRGHGLGAGSMEPGDIAVDNHTVLEEDMVFVVHPNQYLPETGYFLCGEPVRVTASGVEKLSKTWAELGAVGV